MCIVVNYFKLGDTWYLDLPEYLETPGARDEDLERIGSFHEFLEFASSGNATSLRFEFIEQATSDADLLILSGSPGDGSGVYYHLKEFKGQNLDIELWFNQVIYHFTETPPERLYIRQVP
jgi:hypothetical protein